MDKELNEKELYKRKIIETVEKIDNQEFLRFLYQMLQSFKKNGAFNAPLFHTNSLYYRI